MTDVSISGEVADTIFSSLTPTIITDVLISGAVAEFNMESLQSDIWEGEGETIVLGGGKNLCPIGADNCSSVEALGEPGGEGNPNFATSVSDGEGGYAWKIPMVAGYFDEHWTYFAFIGYYWLDDYYFVDDDYTYSFEMKSPDTISANDIIWATLAYDGGEDSDQITFTDQWVQKSLTIYPYGEHWGLDFSISTGVVDEYEEEPPTQYLYIRKQQFEIGDTPTTWENGGEGGEPEPTTFNGLEPDIIEGIGIIIEPPVSDLTIDAPSPTLSLGVTTEAVTSSVTFTALTAGVQETAIAPIGNAIAEGTENIFSTGITITQIIGTAEAEGIIPNVGLLEDLALITLTPSKIPKKYTSYISVIVGGAAKQFQFTITDAYAKMNNETIPVTIVTNGEIENKLRLETNTRCLPTGWKKLDITVKTDDNSNQFRRYIRIME